MYIIKAVCLLIWDGLGFFGFDDTKLARLKGKQVDFLTKFTSLRWIILTFLGSVLILLVIIFEGRKYGEVKSKTISLTEADRYSYEI